MTTAPKTVTAQNGVKLVNLTECELDTIVYRTFSRARFASLLSKSLNGLVRPSMWADPFENFLLGRSVVTEANGTAVSLSSLAEAWYGQCWTLSEESDAIWRIYSPTKGGVRVAARLGDLLDGVAAIAQHASLQVFAGKVLYWTELDIRSYVLSLTFMTLVHGGTNDSFAELLCIKREAFTHEAEVRLLFNDIDPQMGSNGVVNYAFNKSIIRDVVLDPRLTPIGVKRAQNKLKKVGLTIKSTQSDLYRVPNFTIPLE